MPNLRLPFTIDVSLVAHPSSLRIPGTSVQFSRRVLQVLLTCESALLPSSPGDIHFRRRQTGARFTSSAPLASYDCSAISPLLSSMLTVVSSAARRRHATKPKDSSTIHQSRISSPDYASVSQAPTMPSKPSRNHRGQSRLTTSQARDDISQAWSSYPLSNPISTSTFDLNTRPASSASTARSLAERTRATDPFSNQIDRPELDLAEGQVTQSSRSSPALGPAKPRSSTRPRGAKSWKPLDLTKIEDSELDFPDAANGSLVMEPPDYYGRSVTHGASAQNLRQPASLQPFSMLSTGVGDRYAAPTYHYNSSDQLQQFQTQIPRATTAYNYAAVYAHQPSLINRQLSSLYDRSEVLRVFGNTLPGPDHLQRISGSRDGQVQFAQHPNGDISAHQWTGSLFQWTNLGQYSNTRRRIEGQLASDRIKGQSSSMLSQLDTVAYFRAVALQRDPQSGLDSPFGDYRKQVPVKDIYDKPNQLFSASRGSHTAPELQHYSHPQFSTMNNVSDKGSHLAKSIFFPPQTESPRQTQESTGTSTWKSSQPHSKRSDADYESECEYDSLHRIEDNSRTKSTLSDDYFASGRFGRQSSARAHFSGNGNGGMNLYGLTLPRESEVLSSQPHRQQTVGEGCGDIHQSGETALNRFNSDPKVRLPYSSKGYSETMVNPPRYSEFEGSTSRLLHRDSDHHQQRSIMRTVLHDPLRTREPDQSGLPSHHNESVVANSTSVPPGFEASQPRNFDEPPPSSTIADFRDPLRASDPDEERPSQSVYHPIYDADVSDTDAQPSYEKRLNDWWDVRNRFDDDTRFADDFHDRMHGRHPSYNLSNEMGYTAGDGLLSALYCTLSSYVPGSANSRHDYCPRFGEPPEWCIDKTVAGSKSLFGEDWGAPPPRVGRDPRYRPIVPDARYTTYDDPDRRSGYDTRFRLGGSQGY